MNVVILDHFNCHGGAQEYAIDIAKGMCDSGETVFLPTIEMSSLAEQAQGVPSTGFSLLARSPRSLKFYLKGIRNVFQLRKFLEKNKIDILHCNAVPVLLLAKMTRRHEKIIYAYHISHPSKFKRFLINWCADSIIYVSQAMKKEAIEMGATLPSTVIYNGLYDFSIDMPTREKTVFGIPGRITEEKGILLFIAAAKRILSLRDDCEFHIIGKFEDHTFEQEVNRQISSTDGVCIVPFFTCKEELYSSIDVVVNATIINEPLGRTLIEAGIASLPVIAPNRGGPTEIVEDGVSGILFQSSDEDSLCDAMERLAGDESVRAAMGKEGNRIFRKKFAVDTVVNQILAYYKEA